MDKIRARIAARRAEKDKQPQNTEATIIEAGKKRPREEPKSEKIELDEEDERVKDKLGERGAVRVFYGEGKEERLARLQALEENAPDIDGDGRKKRARVEETIESDEVPDSVEERAPKMPRKVRSSPNAGPMELVCGSAGDVTWYGHDGRAIEEGAWGATVASRETAIEVGDVGGHGTTTFPPVRESALTSPAQPSTRALPDGRFVYRFIRALLHEWELDLSSRSEQLSDSSLGRKQTEMYHQIRAHLKPLLRSIRRGTINKDVLEHAKRIALLIQHREFRLAIDQYHHLAIGNSPWPMGVTNAGIHERSSRTRLFAESVAHILNDEETKQYVVALRQLIMYAQRRFPNEEPSRRFGYAPKPGTRK